MENHRGRRDHPSRAIVGGESVMVARAATNVDGRTDPPLLSGRPVPIATDELRFHIGEHFRRAGLTLTEPAFLDGVPIHFGVAEPEGPYRAPLVASPWRNQTYRAS